MESMQLLTSLAARAGICCLLILLAKAGLQAPAWAGGFGNRHVLILGIDGCRSDGLVAANAPNLKALAAGGSVAYSAFAGGELGSPTQQPTISAPGWTSILTGVWTDKHRVTENTFTGFDSVNYPHMFRRIKEYNPEAYLSSIVEWAALDTLFVSTAGAYTDLRQLAIDNTTTNLVSRAITNLLTANPDVLYLHFHIPDTVGHTSGFSPSNPAYLAAIEQVDAGIGTLLAALATRPNYSNESWLILAVSDHGGIGTSHGGQTEAERTVFVIANGGGAPERVVVPGPGQTCVASTVLTFLGVPLQPEWGLMSAPFGVPLTNNLAVYLSFDQTLLAQAGTTNNAAVYASPPAAEARYVDGRIGYAASFSNTGGNGLPQDWAATLGNIDWIYSNSFSLSLWMRQRGSIPATVFANKPPTDDPGWMIGTVDGTNVAWMASDGSAEQADLQPPLLDGEWHLVTVTVNRGANEVLVYLDGQPQKRTGLGLSGLGTLASGLPTLIGAAGDGSHACAADVDDLAIWTRVLSAAEAAEIYAKAQRGKALIEPFSPPPVITVQPLNKATMEGASAQFSVSAAGTGLAYQWQFGGQDVAGATSETLVLTNARAWQAGQYRVTVTNAGGAVTSAVAVLTVLRPPPGATSLAVELRGYYSFESHTNGVVPNSARAAGYPGFENDHAVLYGAEPGSSSSIPPFTTDPSMVRAGTGALDCDGVGDYGNVEGNPVVIDQDWSVAAWFKPDTGGIGYAGSTRAFIFETGGTSYPISFGLRAGTTGNSNFQLYSDYLSGSDPFRDWQVPNANVDRWHHIVVIYRKTGNSIEGYLDGTLTHHITPVATLNPAYAGFHVGTYRTADGRWFKGQIDELALWQRALSSTEVGTLLAAGLAGVTMAVLVDQPGGDSLKPGLKAYYDFDAHTDAVVSNRAGAIGGASFANDALTMRGGRAAPIYPLTQDPALARTGQGALSADGTNDYARINGNPVDPSLSWSVAAWFKPDTGGLGLAGATRAFVFETAGTTYPISFGLRAGTNLATTDFQLYTQTPDSSVAQDYYLPASVVDQWHHILLTYDAEGGSLTGYLDGLRAYRIELGTAAVLQSYAGFHIGTYRGADARWFKGLIDEVGFWQRELTDLEVVQLHALGIARASVLTTAPAIRAFEMSSERSVTLSLGVAAGLKYNLEASGNLSDWQTVVTNLPATSDTVTLLIWPAQPPPPGAYYDPGLDEAPQRFYRVKWNP